VTNEQAADLGNAGQSILLSNTFFDPTMIEVEMVNTTMETLSWELGGNSVRDKQTGIYSVFNRDGNLYKQYLLIERKSQFNQGILDIRQEIQNVNLNKNFDQISKGI
jgi:hypothetical protein